MKEKIAQEINEEEVAHLEAEQEQAANKENQKRHKKKRKMNITLKAVSRNPFILHESKCVDNCQAS